MLCCFPFHSGDAHSLSRLLDWISDLGGCKGHSAVLVADFAVDWQLVFDLKEKAAALFDDVEIAVTWQSINGWPQGPNNLFLTAARHCSKQNKPWLFLETDAIPLKPKFLDALEDEYRKCGAAFMGAFMPCETPELPGVHLSGVSVYPPTAHKLLCKAIMGQFSRAFDLTTDKITIPMAAKTALIHNLWGERDRPPTFAVKNVPGTEVFCPEQINEGAVIFHRNKDGSLIRLLRNRLGIQEKDVRPRGVYAGPFPLGRPVNGAGRVVSLRRSGDIVALLPILKHIGSVRNSPVELVVHSEFLPLLDGVSYIKPLEWTGSWEEPLAAASKFKAVNAQVFGKLVPRPKPGMNFVNTAWEMLGFTWDRYLPLDFDRRDYAREERLAAQVFKTDKPKLLVKLHGFSSPLPDRDFVMSSLNAQFGESAEVVNLDEVGAERLYDLIGLLDRADCMISSDTVTLHLCRASKCPVVALVNGGVFGSSPSVGNVIRRVPYPKIREEWGKITKSIEMAISREQFNEGICLTFSDFMPSEPAAAARHKRAQATWSSLGAVHLPFQGKRDSKSIGDPYGMPFVRDMITAAIASFPRSIIAITNNDIGFHPGLREEVLRSCKEVGCYWSYRLTGQTDTTDMGADFFAFTPKWWNLHREFFSDFLLGYCWWDDMLTRIMLWSGCTEQKRLYFHEPHPGAIETRRNSAGAVYNEKLAMEWLRITGDHRKKPYENIS